MKTLAHYLFIYIRKKKKTEIIKLIVYFLCFYVYVIFIKCLFLCDKLLINDNYSCVFNLNFIN